jgi:hypothetical protein
MENERQSEPRAHHSLRKSQLSGRDSPSPWNDTSRYFLNHPISAISLISQTHTCRLFMRAISTTILNWPYADGFWAVLAGGTMRKPLTRNSPKLETSPCL